MHDVIPTNRTWALLDFLSVDVHRVSEVGVDDGHPVVCVLHVDAAFGPHGQCQGRHRLYRTVLEPKLTATTWCCAELEHVCVEGYLVLQQPPVSFECPHALLVDVVVGLDGHLGRQVVVGAVVGRELVLSVFPYGLHTRIIAIGQLGGPQGPERLAKFESLGEELILEGFAWLIPPWCGLRTVCHIWRRQQWRQLANARKRLTNHPSTTHSVAGSLPTILLPPMG
mmetsp:Transcript_3108/g.7051  ORF Transcript_3108/g.7051 Transcript_3108/m.7051 type:complete len:225 (-) Transcript_3108:25-699(-)